MTRDVKIIMTSWGLALLLFVGIFSFWQWLDDRAERKAMCKLTHTIVGDVPPPEGPAGARARDVRSDLLAYRATLDCGDFE